MKEAEDKKVIQDLFKELAKMTPNERREIYFFILGLKQQNKIQNEQ
jgi:hypothetical protein